MITDSLTKSRKKNIDIRPETFRMLSLKASEQGINLKKYIESLLDSKAEEEEDLFLYNTHVKDNPECWEFLDDAEQAAFEKEIGLCK
jgi:macrodomain Ter protein organizer (MatP/YcbG family)